MGNYCSKLKCCKTEKQITKSPSTSLRSEVSKSSSTSLTSEVSHADQVMVKETFHERFTNIPQSNLDKCGKCRLCKFPFNLFFPAICFHDKCQVRILDPTEHEYVPDFVCENSSSIVGGFDTDAVKNVNVGEEPDVLVSSDDAWKETVLAKKSSLRAQLFFKF